MSKKILYGLPELASEHGEMVDHMLLTVTYFMAVLFVFWSAFLIVALWRFHRRRNPKANYHGITSHWSSHVEIGVVIMEGVLLLGFAFPLWATRVNDYPTDPDVVRLRAVGEKFFWTFHYPGADGQFGRVDPFLISPENHLGLDPEDPNSADDRLSKYEMGLPVGRNVVVEVTSKDVIHNLALVPMRMAQDAIPGTSSHVWFRPTKTGEWDILCGQLCGPGHANMAAKLLVMPEGEFDDWLGGAPVFKPAPAAPEAAASDRDAAEGEGGAGTSTTASAGGNAGPDRDA